jgi:hypothetical protein
VLTTRVVRTTCNFVHVTSHLASLLDQPGYFDSPARWAVAWTENKPVDVRFIEWMPFGGNAWCVSEKDAKLAQMLGQLQSFIAVFASHTWTNLPRLGQPNTFLAVVPSCNAYMYCVPHYIIVAAQGRHEIFVLCGYVEENTSYISGN